MGVIHSLLDWNQTYSDHDADNSTVDVGLADSDRRTALFHAIANGHSEAADILIRESALRDLDLNAGDVEGTSPIHLAASKGNLGCLAESSRHSIN